MALERAFAVPVLFARLTGRSGTYEEAAPDAEAVVPLAFFGSAERRELAREAQLVDAPPLRALADAISARVE